MSFEPISFDIKNDETQERVTISCNVDMYRYFHMVVRYQTPYQMEDRAIQMEQYKPNGTWERQAKVLLINVFNTLPIQNQGHKEKAVNVAGEMIKRYIASETMLSKGYTITGSSGNYIEGSGMTEDLLAIKKQFEAIDAKRAHQKKAREKRKGSKKAKPLPK